MTVEELYREEAGKFAAVNDSRLDDIFEEAHRPMREKQAREAVHNQALDKMEAAGVKLPTIKTVQPGIPRVRLPSVHEKL